MLEWSSAEFDEALEATSAALREFVLASQRGEGRPVTMRPLADVTRDLSLEEWLGRGGMRADDFAAFLARFLDVATRLHHPRYLAHQVAAPDVPSVLADLVHACINNSMAVYEMGPGGTAVELAVVRWMLRRVGWDAPASSGVLTHGGSLANLTALLAARARSAPDAWEEGTPRDLVVLAPPIAHYSVVRSVAMLGLGARAVRALPVDAFGRIDVARVGECIDAQRASGRRVMAVVANACSTGTGLHDDLRSIARSCRDRGVWLHVDGAHGASALVSPRLRERLAGLDAADSVVWDAHKMLRTSSLCAAVLVRRAEDLACAFHQNATYLFDAERAHGVDIATYSIECTKATLGLKLFLNIAWRGADGLASYVERQYDLTREFYDVLRERPGFECPYEPETNILCFRYGDDDALQDRIRRRLLEDGAFHLSATHIGERRYLRIVVMTPATSRGTAEALAEAVAAAARVR